ncbi:MAG: ATP-binding protein [Candidatus Bathyarchaeota archaeon]|nr:ATP-binding protein [Candidatus Bathyarchaeota archaeon]
MKLTKKLVIIFGVSYVLIFMGVFVTTNQFLMRGFLNIEMKDIQTQTELGLHTLDLRIKELDQTTQGFAANDDTYYFMQSSFKHFINDLMSSSTFIGSEISFMVFIDNNGLIVHTKAFDLMELKSVPVLPSMINYIQKETATQGSDLQRGVSGMIMTDEGPVIISSRRILTSDQSGPVMGSLICGRYLDEIEIDKLREATFLSLNIHDVMYLPEEVEYNTLFLHTNPDNIVIERSSEDRVAGFVGLYDIYGESILFMQVDAPREFYKQGLLSLSYFLGSSVLVGATVALIAIISMNKFILSKIVKLSSEVSQIDPHSIDTRKLTIPGEDEISTLSENIDEMLEALNEYQYRLKESERMATIGQTSAMVGHDLRNPLQVIFMLNSRLKKRIDKMKDSGMTSKDIKELEYLDSRFREQTSYMDKIVSDLQDFSRTIKLVIEETDLEQIVHDVLETLNLSMDTIVSVSFEETLRRVLVDGNILRRVFQNLLTNAVQAMPEGGNLTVEGSVVENQAVIVVSDTGTGISEENMSKMFQPLFTTKAKGTGLGLAVCKRIVEAHGGEISIESEEGVGTSFTVSIPLVLSEEEGKVHTEEQDAQLLHEISMLTDPPIQVDSGVQ